MTNLNLLQKVICWVIIYYLKILKESFAVFVLSALTVGNLIAQCPSGSVMLGSQTDVDVFVANYPNCDEIDGSLFIRNDFSGFEIYDLSGLSSIEAVKTNLIIKDNPRLTNLSGLQNIRSIGSITLNGGIGGKLEIDNNEQLTDISGLVNAEFSELIISNNADLSNCAIANICNFINFPYTNSTNYQIDFNAIGCFNENDLFNSCSTLPGCSAGDVIITTASEFITFASTYRDCEEINGNFIIDGTNSAITNVSISPLFPQITKITGDLIIKNTELTTTNFLDNVAEIGGDFQIINNRMFGIGLDDLSTLGGSFVVANNSISASISFDKLSAIGNELIFTNNSNLKNLTGLQGISAVNGNLIKIENNAVLTNLEGLHNIEIPNGASLVIQNNQQLSICSQQNICNFLEADGNHTIDSNSTGCNNKTQILDACSIVSVCPTGNIVLTSQAEVDQFVADFPNCLQVSGNFTINSSTGQVTDLSGLSNVSSILGNLLIEDNSNLANLSGFENLQLVSGRLTIDNNDLLNDLSGFQSLTNISSFLIVDDNNNLVKLTGLENLTSIGNLSIDSNQNLVDILALQNVNTINGGQIGISGNPSLTSLDGIENISNIIRVIIKDNPNVSICNFQNICQSLENTSFSAISGNASGCENKGAVSIACGNTALVVAAIINEGDTLYVKKGEPITLTQSSANYDYLFWRSSDGQFVSGEEAIFTYDTAGIYTVKLEAGNDTRGSDVASITIIVNEVDIANDNCEGDTLIYTTPNIIPDETHKKIKDWIQFPGNNGTIEVKNNASASFIAGEYVEIKENFSVKVGSELLLDIEDCQENIECATNFNNLLGGDQSDEIYSMEVTNDGGYILAGTSFSSNSGDITNTNAGSTDYWITKLDANANIEWSKLIGDASSNTAYSIIQTDDRNYVVNGTNDLTVKTIKLDANGNEIWSNIFTKSDDFVYLRTDIIETSTGDFIGSGYALKTVPNGINYAGFIYKLNSAGALEWDKELPFRIFSAVEAVNGNYILNGYTNSIGVFGSTDIVLTEFDTNGSLVSDKSYGTSFGELAQEIQATNDGGYIIGGTINEKTNGIGGEIDNYNYLIIKVTASGTKQWQKTYGGDGREYMYSISQTADGGYALGGYSESSNSGDVTKTNNGGRDFWIVKLDASGNLEWENLVGSSEDDIPRSVRQAADGGYVVVGYTEDGTGGDLIEESNGETDAWFVKLDSNGELLQTTPCDTVPPVEPEPVDSIVCVTDILNNLYGGNGADYVENMELTADGGYITTGYSTSSISGDVYDTNIGANDFWVMKLNKNGTVDWSRLYGYRGQDKAYSVSQTTDGGYVVAGASVISNNVYSGSIIKLNSIGDEIWNSQISAVDLNLVIREITETIDGGYITTGTSSDKTSFVAKFDITGNLSWTKNFNVTAGLSIDQAQNSNYYVSGYDDNITNEEQKDSWIAYLSDDGTPIWENFYGLDLSDENCIDGVISNDGGYVAGSSTNTSGTFDYQIFKIDTTGAMLWETVIGGDGRDVLYSIELTNDGGYIVGGYSESSNTGDVDMQGNGGRDFWIIKLNSSGDVEWKNLIGGSYNEDLKNIHQTAEGGYIVAGNSLSSNTGDISDNTNGGRDGWLVKLNANGEIEQNDTCEPITSRLVVEEQSEY